VDARSEKNLRGVHPRLVAVVHRAAEIVADRNDSLGFIVTEGLRTSMRQAQLVKAGASRTMNSRHLTGHAVDLAATVDGEVRWAWPLYGTLNESMQQAAHEQGTVITWGGSWKSFKDGCHWEIDPQAYRT
jgi:peptidoglycan L-alanyl-D-glutamate endopeptidase CwlK